MSCYSVISGQNMVEKGEKGLSREEWIELESRDAANVNQTLDIAALQ